MAEPRIVIVDYQAGNLRSVAKALEKAGCKPVITSDQEDVRQADALVFPGQGSNDASMRALKAMSLVEPIKAFIQSGRPFLGVCLGLQLLLEVSDEGVEPGLGVLAGRVRHLPPGLKVPHMGWNQVELCQGHPVLQGIPQGSHFYFVHSYYPEPEDGSVVAGKTTYGIEFCSVVARDNMVATQFHPEKSGTLGLRIYRNFVKFVVSRGRQGLWK